MFQEIASRNKAGQYHSFPGSSAEGDTSSPIVLFCTQLPRGRAWTSQDLRTKYLKKPLPFSPSHPFPSHIPKLFMPSCGRNCTLIYKQGAQTQTGDSHLSHFPPCGPLISLAFASDLHCKRCQTNWALFLSQPCQFHGSNEAVFSSWDSYREHFAAIAAIQHVIKVVLNSHMYFDSQLFSCRVGFFFLF